MSKLFLVRHGSTNWNIKGQWQGQTDIPLSEEGEKQLDITDDILKNEKIDIAYTGTLSRLKQSEEFIAKDLKLKIPVYEDSALNERDYGLYVGRNKWDFDKEFGDEFFERVRRGWDTKIPEGETLEDVYHRVVPFYQKVIKPELQKNKNVLIVSSGNTLRALIKYLENLSVEEVEKLELGFAEIRIYEVNASTSPHLVESSQKVQL